MDLLQELGTVALGSRLRRLGEAFAADAARINEIYRVGIQPKWFPVFYLLSRRGESSITAMAKEIGCSHPVVSLAVKAMTEAGLVEAGEGGSDARVNTVRLSDAGRALLPHLERQMHDVSRAVDELMRDMRHDLWQAIEETEDLLREQGLFERVQAVRRRRAAREVEIADFAPEDHAAFKQLNYEWIEASFTVEEEDRDLLEHPGERILGPGGAILVARHEGAVAGVCALMPTEGGVFELAKMAVEEHARGLGIGRMLGEAAVARGRDLGARALVIQSNTKLRAAINLYRSLGFREVPRTPSPYEKCNIQLELDLSGR